MSARFEVGQTVLVSGVNLSKPYEAEVVKVGRKLVYIEKYGRQIAYRIDTGVINDQYGHTHIQTLEEAAISKAHKEVLERLARLGLVQKPWGCPSYSVETLDAVCRLLEEEHYVWMSEHQAAIR